MAAMGVELPRSFPECQAAARERRPGRRRALWRLLAALAVAATGPAAGAAEARLRLATTTSTENSGLLGHLLPRFEKSCGCKVDVIAVGTGKALKLGERGDVDVVLVHARRLEDKFVAEGFGVDRRDVMYNDFVVLGPAADPAGVKGAGDAAQALARIAKAGAPFVSRGDQSGTHEKEQELWRLAGGVPQAKWYLEAGQGMSEVISMALERSAYTLADRATFQAHPGRAGLAVLSQGDPALFNPYGVIAVNPERHPAVAAALARRFMDFLTGPEGRRAIVDFQVAGQQLFFLPAR
jgi:tungstate transport system substrate-binding protein